MRIVNKILRSLCPLLVLTLTSCGDDDKKSKYGKGVFNFDASTIVADATPMQLQNGVAAGTLTQQQTTSEIVQLKERLYLSQAENSIPNMIENFQGRVDELNTRTAGLDEDAVPTCLTATGESVDIAMPDGSTVAMLVQCYENLSDTSFLIWGQDSEGVSHIYERSTVSTSLVTVTPQADGNNVLDGYLSFLPSAADEAGTIVHIVADQSAKTVQANMVAPHEICGVNMFATAEKIHFRGSISTTTANACPPEADYVYSATDLTESTGFDATLLIDDQYFMKRTSGNKQVNGATQTYEEYANTGGQGNVSLGYAADPATSDSDVNFGPASANGLGGSEFLPK